MVLPQVQESEPDLAVGVSNQRATTLQDCLEPVSSTEVVSAVAVHRPSEAAADQPGASTAGRYGADAVIATKLYPPRLRQEPVGRERLLRRLDEVLTVPLTVVVAPAGWGKSTVVVHWLDRVSVSAGWVCLDSGDEDPHRFWRYLLLAVH